MILSLFIHSFILSQSMNLNEQPLLCMDEGLYCRADKRRAFELNCSGAGITCTQTGGRMTLTVTGGSGPAGKVAEAYAADASITAQAFEANPSDCSAGQYATTIAANGNLTCAQVAYSQLSGTPTIPADISGAGYWTKTSEASLSNEVAMSSLATGIVINTTTTGVPTIKGTNTCTNQFPRSDNASGTWTCASIATTDLPTVPVTKGGTNLTTVAANQVFVGTAADTLTAKTIPSCSNATASKLLYDNATQTWSCGTDQTSAGGGGNPGGVLGSVQYFSDAGVFGGMSGLGTDGTDLIFVERSTHATNPASGTSVLYLFDHYGAGSPAALQVGSVALGFDQHLSPYPFMRSDDAWWGCVLPSAHGQTTYTVTGRAAAGTATGTAAAVAWASTDARTRQVWIQHPAAATANTNAGYRSNIDYMWRGNATDLGGFLWWGAFALSTVTATTRVFAGLKDATAIITATSDPNVTLDAVYFGCNAADSNLSICSNDNTSTATCTTLGANFPCHTNNAAYDVALWSAANGSTIGYWIRNLTSGTEATGSLSTDLPRNTVQLNWEFTANTGGTASAVNIHIGGTCWLANP